MQEIKRSNMGKVALVLNILVKLYTQIDYVLSFLKTHKIFLGPVAQW